MQKVNFNIIKIKILASKNPDFTGIFAFLHSIKSEFLPSNWGTQKIKAFFQLNPTVVFLPIKFIIVTATYFC
ncbi:Hypothetical protein MOVI_1030 [Mesomycoplasma ovipneumoniae 14811]|uniref:Uncharacterized protein n=1 Tax=Mesomycoplasma ovipneumoniae 14811 TaxID=1188239 RepID=A0A014KWL1_9BACT|nr:Hypothetical protein MOVI_1030 [Mesomycoplasma ovipneumoniae 14811]